MIHGFPYLSSYDSVFCFLWCRANSPFLRTTMQYDMILCRMLGELFTATISHSLPEWFSKGGGLLFDSYSVSAGCSC